MGLTCTKYCAAPWNTRLPVIAIDEPGVPLPGAKMPEIVLLAPVTVPAPCNTANVWLKPFKSRIAPPETVKRLLVPNAAAFPARSVPPPTTVAPL